MKYTTSQNPNYPALTLSLDHNNPGIEKDRNPIPFNSPGSYQCQPGKCIYGAGSPGNQVSIDVTSELYYYCGGSAKLSNTCSIQDSASIVRKITDYGGFAVESEVSNVSEVSTKAAYLHLTCDLTPAVSLYSYRHLRVSTKRQKHSKLLSMAEFSSPTTITVS